MYHPDHLYDLYRANRVDDATTRVHLRAAARRRPRSASLSLILAVVVVPFILAPVAVFLS